MVQAEIDVAKLNEAVREESLQIQAAMDEVKKVIVGQKGLVDRMMVALLCRGHLLVEGVPGLAKTLAVKTLGQVLDLQFARIQFTPDLLPADLVGTMIYQQKTGEFAARKGPVFTNLLLADEINRAPAKVQSALLESMQERQVTLGDTSHPLPDPFLVFATQNPIEQEGTYPLPEAQVDRFLLKTKVDYPKKEEERQILDRMITGRGPARHPAREGATRCSAWRAGCATSTSTAASATTSWPSSSPPVTPRRWASPSSRRSSPSGPRPAPPWPSRRPPAPWPSCAGRGYVVPEDVKEIAKDVLRHRILLTYEAEAENVTTETIVDRVLERVEVPVTAHA